MSIINNVTMLAIILSGFAQAILYRGAGIDVIWPEFVIIALIGGLFFALVILRFRSVAA